MVLPPFNETDELSSGVHRATLSEVIERFGRGSPQRKVVSLRLERIFGIAQATGHLARFVVFGSFVTATNTPRDVDVFMVMDESFEVASYSGESRMLFDHSMAQDHFGASVFWLRRPAALGGEQAAIEHWQLKRDGNQRGIVEIIAEES